ncbi:MAG: carbohydrate ABC transporter permease [Clostridiales bacterium]|nr:carbohydrate ABC transporter permease [Clostridiales bacterium]
MGKLRLTGEDVAMNAISALAVMAVFVVTLYPVWYCLIYALNDNVDSIKGDLYILPRVFTLENFKTIFRNVNVICSYGVSAARTLLGTLYSLALMMPAAYALTKRGKLRFYKFYTAVFIVSMYFSGGIIPFYLLLMNMRLLNTFWVYILPGAVGYFNLLLIMAFLRELPSALEDSAMIDGANVFQILIMVVTPLSKPVIATIAMFVAVGHWNDWFSTAYYTTDPNLMTISTYLTKLVQEEQAKASMQSLAQNTVTKQMLAADMLKYACLIATIAPIVMVYPFVQKFLVQGMMVGSIKA